MLKNCPKCGVTWEGKEIPQGLLDTGLYGGINECKELAKAYGWTEDNKKKFNVNVVYCKQYREDGIKDRYYLCTSCNCRIDLI